MSKAVVKVPAKVIVSGEHAVVHGAPALASAANLFSEICVFETDEPFVFLSLNSYKYRIPRVAFNAFRDKIGASFEAAESVLEDNADAFGLCFILDLVFSALDFTLNKGVEIAIASPADPGSGLGFSAGYSAGLLYAFANLFGFVLQQSDFEELVETAETYFHGTPSGIDQYAVLNGGFFIFEKKDTRITPVFSDAPFLKNMFLVFTGKPESSTREAVEKARGYFDKNGIDDFVRVTRDFQNALSTKDVDLFQRSLNFNQKLLSEAGISSVFADTLSRDLEHLGGALKITGAGTARGDVVGMMLGWHNDIGIARGYFEEKNMPFFSIELNIPGLLTS